MAYLDFVYTVTSTFVSSLFFNSWWLYVFAFGCAIGVVVLVKHIIFISSR